MSAGPSTTSAPRPTGWKRLARRIPAPRTRPAVAGADLAAGALFALAALALAPVALTGDAGPFGFAAVFPALFAGLALVPLTAAVVLRLLGWRAAHRHPPIALAAGALALAVVVAGIPFGDAVRRRLDDRAAEQAERRIEALATACAGAAVAAVPDEVETNPGVAMRPELTARFQVCLESAPERLGCTPGGCSTTLVHLRHARRPTVLVDGRTYLDRALHRRGRGHYDRSWPDAAHGYDPRGTWRVPADGG